MSMVNFSTNILYLLDAPKGRIGKNRHNLFDRKFPCINKKSKTHGYFTIVISSICAINYPVKISAKGGIQIENAWIPPYQVRGRLNQVRNDNIWKVIYGNPSVSSAIGTG
jgi:hypothetical protein